MRTLALLFAVGCSTVSPRPPLTVAPEVLQGGSTIYFGSSFPLKGEAAAPSFIYERRVGAQNSTHLTRDPTGAIAIAESATHTADYELGEYTLHTNQQGQRGSIGVEGDEVTFQLEGRSVKERQSAPVVVGPTLVGFIFRHLSALRTGERFSVRFAVLERMETIGFELKAVEAEPGLTRVRMTASGFFVSLAVAPSFFTFETASGKLVRIEGRIPPKVRSGKGWADFDARVEYRYVAETYR